MSKRQDKTLLQQMASLLPSAWLEKQARDLAVVRRQRLVHVADFVWTLILAFGSGKDCSLTSLHGTFERHTNQKLAQNSFNKRFTPQMATLMVSCVHLLLEQALQGLPRFEPGWLDHFSKLTAIDATVIKVHHSLRKLWPSTTPGQAAVKLHAIYNLTHALPHKLKLSQGTLHDSKAWRDIGHWASGHLFLFDLGYYSFSFFASLCRHQAFFVTRAKMNFDPVIVAVNGTWPGRAMKLEGKTLSEVLPRLKRQFVDVMVEVSYKGPKRKGKAKTETLRLRMVLVLNKASGEYHRYLCNLDPAVQSAQEVEALYKLRWEIELLFKSLKSASGGLGRIPGRRACVVECLLWASVAKLLLSRILLRRARKMRGLQERHLPENRWDKRFSDITGDLLQVLVVRRCSERSRDPFMDFLCRCASDPNPKRRNNLDSLVIY